MNVMVAINMKVAKEVRKCEFEMYGYIYKYLKLETYINNISNSVFFLEKGFTSPTCTVV
jgi:hypothetical protein